MPAYDGGPAFPNGETETHSEWCGMTLRDWFAGMAMQGILSADTKENLSVDVVARIAYDQADAMLISEEYHEKGTT